MIEDAPPETITQDSSPLATIKSIWISVIAILFFQFDYLEDEICELASRRRFWLTVLSGFVLSWLVASCSQYFAFAMQVGTLPLNNVAFNFFWVSTDMILIPLVLLLIATILSGQVFGDDVIEHAQAIAIVMVVRMVAMAILTIVTVIIRVNVTGDPFWTLEGWQQEALSPTFTAIHLSVFVLIAGLCYVLLMRAFFIAHEGAEIKRVLLAVGIVILCVDVANLIVVEVLDRMPITVIVYETFQRLFGVQ